MSKTFLNIWKRYIELANINNPKDEQIVSDIDHLYEINAHKELIEAAKYHPGYAYDVFVTPSKLMRESSPDFFRHSLIIGDDGSGNFVIWMNVQNIYSKILWVCHDPSVIIVLANSAIEYIEGVILGFNSPTFYEREESALGNYFEYVKLRDLESTIWQKDFYNGERNELGLVEKKSNDKYRIFDFNHAEVGAGISLKINGKYTIVKASDNAGMIYVGTLEKDKIKKEKRNFFIANIFMLLLFSVLFYFFYQINCATKENLVKSLILAFGSYLLALGVGIRAYFGITDLLRRKK